MTVPGHCELWYETLETGARPPELLIESEIASIVQPEPAAAARSQVTNARGLLDETFIDSIVSLAGAFQAASLINPPSAPILKLAMLWPVLKRRKFPGAETAISETPSPSMAFGVGS